MEDQIAQQAECLERNAPELLNHIYSKLLILSQNEVGLNSEQAKQLATQTCRMIAEDFGGESIYIPKNVLAQVNARDMKIFNEFNGTNHRELARKYNVSMVWVYHIVKKIRKQEIAKRQYDMFAEAA